MSMSVANSRTYLNPEGSSSEGGCMPQRSRSEKRLIAYSAAVTGSCIVLIIVLAVIATKKKEDVVPDSPACMSPGCRDAAAHFLQIMNTSADPCNDFHEFVCGKWVNETQIPPEKSRYGVFDDLRDELVNTCTEQLEIPGVPEPPLTAADKTKTFHQACLKTEGVSRSDGIAQLQNILKGVGLSPTPMQEPTGFDLYDVLSKIIKGYGFGFIINFSVGPDDKNTTYNIIILDQPDTFGLGKNFLKGNASDPRVIAYKKYMADAFRMLDPKSDDAVVDETYDLEVAIAQRTRDLVDRRSSSTWYFKYTFGELKTLVPNINFLEFSKKILGDKADLVTENSEAITKEETYFRNVSEYLNTATNRAKNNYLAWRMMQSLGPLLFKDFRTLKFAFDKVNSGIAKPEAIQQVCFDKTNDFFGHAVGRIYVDQKFSSDEKKEVEDMVTNLAKAFRKLLDENTWMDAVTRQKARDKLEKMVSFIGYPEWTKDDQVLNEYYNVSGVTISKFETSLTSTASFTVEKALSKLDQTNKRTTEWVSQASIVNAFYNPSANSITFPAGILQPPFYGKGPSYLNYGAIGYVIGHEITHGYDDQGSEYDGDGNIADWWTNTTRTEFDKGKKCFIDQYSAIKDPLSGMNLNGEQTIGENIADCGGIRQAFQAYLLSGRTFDRLPGLPQYTDLHLFYMSAASVWCTKFRKEGMINQINDGVHSPGMYRAYVPLANTEDFAKIFNCPAGSKMNPGGNRCRVW